ncbi:hypothetical protein CRI94_16555 [Longibacter salinarum]|uniref:ABC transporter permease n=1 Tax=Longibacter salinarum TaxID=1850348 RepID=A0A2A8CTY4_9BACT|nr:ABC transporter permease [Longibacter salinarum]PEN11197.1 hypothetical protein CRI94_16555 [Longibacter salinarum]
MLNNYLKTAARSIRRNAGYAAINVIGLAVGIAVCLLIAVFVRYELSYDDFHENSERTYRIVSDWGDFSVPATSWPLVKAFETDYPDVQVVRIDPVTAILDHDEQRFTRERIFVANSAFLDVFSFDLLRGDRASALERPETALVTPAAAKRFFGTAEAIGQTLRVNGEEEVEVVGIVEAAPAASHFHYDVLVSWSTLDAWMNYSEVRADAWGANGIYTYLQLPDGMSRSALESELPDLIERHAGADWNGSTLSLQPLTAIHLHSNHNMEIEANGSIAVLYVFGVIGLFVLLLACVNFMNLATARATERAAEVGVRKTIGAYRGQLIGQFFAESMLLAFVALVIALAVAAAVTPLVSKAIGLPLTTGMLLAPGALALLLVITMAAGLLAGSYPALYLSRFQPATALRGSTEPTGAAHRLRQGLVVFQFAVSTILIIGTTAAYLQLDHLRTASPGFNAEQVVTVPMQSDDAMSAYASFRDQALRSPHILGVSVGSVDFPSELLDGNGYGFAGTGVPDDSLLGIRTISVGHDFFETLGVPVVAGRTFSRERAADSTAYVVNRTALRLMQRQAPDVLSAEEAVGRTIRAWGDWPFSPAPLIGVVDDVHFATLREQVEPMIFYIEPDDYSTLYVRVDAAQTEAALADLRGTWENVHAAWPFEYAFADQRFASSYRAEQRLGILFALFSALAILIACLGLFGLAAFTARQRTKEIGIRKALGATAAQVVGLLTKEFVRLVALAVVVAMPVAYVLMSRWLDTFASHISLGASVFLIAGLGAMVTAVVTVSVQAFRAARLDPTKALRTD